MTRLPTFDERVVSRFQPGPRFCHVAAVYKNSMFVFGGYDGSSRLNDFLEFKFWPGKWDRQKEGKPVSGE